MDSLRDRHKGERAFIVGSGPSLARTVGLDGLSKEVAFACSRLRLWKECPFTPMYQVVTENGHIAELGSYTFADTRERFLVRQVKIDVPGWAWVEKAPNEKYIAAFGMAGLSDGWEAPRNGRSSALIAVQIALWMGCDPIYLVGCDTTFVGHVWDITETWNEHGLERHLAAFRRAAGDMRTAGRSLIDCTVGGQLSLHGVLDYQALDGILSKKIIKRKRKAV